MLRVFFWGGSSHDWPPGCHPRWHANADFFWEHDLPNHSTHFQVFPRQKDKMSTSMVKMFIEISLWWCEDVIGEGMIRETLLLLDVTWCLLKQHVKGIDTYSIICIMFRTPKIYINMPLRKYSIDYFNVVNPCGNLPPRWLYKLGQQKVDMRSLFWGGVTWIDYIYIYTVVSLFTLFKQHLLRGYSKFVRTTCHTTQI